MAGFDLQLFTSILNTTPAFVADLTPQPSLGFVSANRPQAIGWRRTIRDMGGYWEGSFQLNGSEAQLLNA